MAWYSEIAVLGPVIGGVGTVVGALAKVYVDKRKSAAEERVRAAEIAQDAAADEATQEHLERAAERDHEVVKALLSGFTAGLAEVRTQIEANHDKTLALLAEQRRESDARIVRIEQRVERIAESAIFALAKIGDKAEIKKD